MNEFKVVNEKENLLFGRKEIIIKIQSPILPSQADIKKNVSEKYSTDLKNIKIRNISANYGSKDFSADVFVYKNEKDKKDIELAKKKDNKSSGHETKAEVKQ